MAVISLEMLCDAAGNTTPEHHGPAGSKVQASVKNRWLTRSTGERFASYGGDIAETPCRKGQGVGNPFSTERRETVPSATRCWPVDLWWRSVALVYLLLFASRTCCPAVPAAAPSEHLVQGLAVVCQDGVDFESHLAVWQSRAFRNDSYGVRWIRTPTGEFVRVINKIWPSLLADHL